MPLDPVSSDRPWVAYRVAPAAFARREVQPSPAYEPPPSYDEAMLTSAPVPRQLPSSRAVPMAVTNEPSAWRLRFSRPLHPEAQHRKLQKQLERRERTERKLDAACRHLDSVLRQHDTLSASGGVYCGGGLFDEDECSAISNARGEVAHYLEKKRELQAAHAAMLRRTPAQVSPG